MKSVIVNLELTNESWLIGKRSV